MGNKTKSINNQIDKYINEIGSLIFCDSKEKKRFLESFREDIYRYCEEEESIENINQIYHHFGEPENIALYFYDENNLTEIKKRMNVRKTLKICAIVLVIVALLIWAISMTIVVVDSHRVANGYNVNESAVIEEAFIHITNLL